MSAPRIRFLPILAALSVICVASAAVAQLPTRATPARARFTVTSPDLQVRGRVAQSHVFNGMGCTGQNISPVLQWNNPPAGTKSFAVTAYDPDAPTGGGWWHWVIYNIPASVNRLAADAGKPGGRMAPRGSVQGNTDFGTAGYGGPCPPPGDKPHRYIFTVYALKVDRLNLPRNATAAYVGFNLHANVLGTAQITALYGR